MILVKYLVVKKKGTVQLVVWGSKERLCDGYFDIIHDLSTWFDNICIMLVGCPLRASFDQMNI